MKNRFRKLTAVLLAVLIAISVISVIPSFAADSEPEHHYYLVGDRRLIPTGWSATLSTIELKEKRFEDREYYYQGFRNIEPGAYSLMVVEYVGDDRSHPIWHGNKMGLPFRFYVGSKGYFYIDYFPETNTIIDENYTNNGNVSDIIINDSNTIDGLYCYPGNGGGLYRYLSPAYLAVTEGTWGGSFDNIVPVNIALKNGDTVKLHSIPIYAPTFMFTYVLNDAPGLATFGAEQEDSTYSTIERFDDGFVMSGNMKYNSSYACNVNLDDCEIGFGDYPVFYDVELSVSVNFNYEKSRGSGRWTMKCTRLNDPNADPWPQSYYYTSYTTGISGFLPDDIELDVDELNASDYSDTQLDDGLMINKVYDINLLKNGEKIQPESEVLIQIPCQNENAKVYRIENDGSVTDMNADYNDGKIEFMTDHFSIYAVAADGDIVEDKPIIGDVNGDSAVDVLDATLIQKYTVDKAELTDEQVAAADVNNDNVVDILDASDIQKLSVDKITGFKRQTV